MDQKECCIKSSQMKFQFISHINRMTEKKVSESIDTCKKGSGHQDNQKEKFE